MRCGQSCWLNLHSRHPYHRHRILFAVLAAIAILAFFVTFTSFLPLVVFVLILLAGFFAGLSTFGFLGCSLRNRAIGRVIVLALTVRGVFVVARSVALARITLTAAVAGCLLLVDFSLEKFGKVVGSYSSEP